MRWYALLLSGAAVGLFLVLASSIAVRAATESIQYDDAYNASVAKNLAAGHGYATSYQDFILFNPEVSTGPGLLVPFAAFVAVFGNTWWAPAAFSGAGNLALLVIVLYLVRRMFPSSARRDVFVILLVAGVWVFMAAGWLALWHQLLGEVPGALLATIACILLFERGERDSAGCALFAGLLFGLAFLIKNILLFAFAASAVTALVVSRKGGAGVLRRVASIACAATGFAIPWVIFEAGKRIVLGAEGFALLKMREREFFAASGSGLNQLFAAQDVWALMTGNVSKNFEVFRAFAGHQFGAAALIALIILGLAVAMLRRKNAFAAGGALFLAAAMQLAWWLALSPRGDLRHVVPAVIFMVIAAAMLIAREPSRAFSAVLLLLLVAGASGRIADLPPVYPPHLGKSPRLEALLATSDFLRSRPQIGPLVGCRWWANRDLEYILPGSLNFKNFESLDPAARTRAVLVRSDFWNWERSPELDRIAAACDQNILFRRDPFTVCSFAGARPLDEHRE